MGGLVIRAVMAASLMAAASRAEAGERFGAKTGLWELLSRPVAPRGSDAVPTKMFATMSPSQRVQTQALLDKMDALVRRAARPHVKQECLTEDDFRTGLHATAHGDASLCDTEVMQLTTTTMNLRGRCRDQETMTSTFHIDSVNPEKFVGTRSETHHLPGGEMSRGFSVVGTWLGDNCNDVKPIS
jgi:hypothetical protein